MARGRADTAVEEPNLDGVRSAPSLHVQRRSLTALVSALSATLLWAGPAIAQPNPSVLPDGRGWELVSPAEKGGASVDPLGQGVEGLLGGLDQASEDGSALTYSATGPVEREPEANRAPEGVQIISRRGPSGWSSKGIITPIEKAEGAPGGAPQEYRLFSPDLSLAAVQPFGRRPKGEGEHPSKFQEPPLAGNTPEERGLYVRHNETCEPVVKSPSCFQPIVTSANNTAGAEFGEQLEYLGASKDLSHVVFRSQVALTSESQFPLAGGFLYLWDRAAPEQLQLVSKAPLKSEVEFEAHPMLGYEAEEVFQNARNAVSTGGRVFWTLEEAGTAGAFLLLFAHDSTTGKSMQINVAQPGVKNPSKEQLEEKEVETEVRYQSASADGSRVFFTSTLRLTESSEFPLKRTGPPADLYACDLPAEITETSTCSTLTDLSIATPTPTGNPRSAEVMASVIGNADNGNTIYFVTNRPLRETQGSAPNGESPVEGKCTRPKSEKEPPATAKCNLYMRRFQNGEWEPPRLVAVLSQDDSTDWARNGEHLSTLTARLSPSGDFLAFQSDRELTGYDNHDANSGKPDEEVFLYNAEGEGKLVCASCNPNPGHRPTGLLDKKAQVNGEENGVLVDPAGRVWNPEGSPLEGRWLSGSIPGWTPLSTFYSPTQARYLLDNGRLFFNSADALVSFPGQVTQRPENAEGKLMQVGVENVYEYEPDGVGNCHQAQGCVSLISSGTSENESAFLEASLSGNDAFFVTTEKLFATDPDLTYDAYDAHVCEPASPCIQPPPPASPPCEGEAGCKRPTGPGSPGSGGGGTSLFSGPGNPPGKVEVRGEKEKGKGKTPSRKQLLAKALSKCKKRYKHAKKKRIACERQARKKYGATKAKKK